MQKFILVRYANHYIKHKYVMQKFIVVRYANHYIKHKYVNAKVYAGKAC